MTKRFPLQAALTLLCFNILFTAIGAENRFIGDWELTISGPGGSAGWLSVQQKGGQLGASIMWRAGSVEPVASVTFDRPELLLTRKHEVERRDAQGNKTKVTNIETIRCNLSGDLLRGVSSKPRDNGNGQEVVEFTGRQEPRMPPAPILSAVRYGSPIQLFNGKDLTGWRLTDPKAVNGWSVKDGLLVNNPVQEEGKHKNYGNLRTDQEFEDFNLQVEVRVSKGQNSGVYVRGIYEVQVADTYGRALDSHNMGAVYSRIKPLVSAEKPPGEWQTMDLSFVDRHMTVILNGQKIIDNQPVLGCTGGALWSDVSRPGPIYLQGDHTGIEYRKLELRPVVR